MKRAVLLGIAAGVVLSLVSCGNNYNNSLYGAATPSGNTNSKHPISKLNLRAFVTNQLSSQVQILDAKNDANFGAVIATQAAPTQLQLTHDGKLALVFASGPNEFEAIDTTTEAITGSVPIPNWTESFVIALDNNTVYAAVRNMSTATSTVAGAVELVNLTQAAVTNTIAIPKAHWVVLSHSGAKLLVFSDDSNSMTVVNTSDLSTTTVSGLDRPVWGVFSADDSTAYIMNCGAQCGGTQASVSMLSLGTNKVGVTTAVEGATMGLLDGSNLYVAGTGAGGGKMDILNASNLAVTKSGIAVSDGYHWRMSLISGQLFVGARQCSNTAHGCLAIYNTSSGSSTLPAALGDVTGIEAIPNRPVVYVVQGGELVIYNTTTGAPQSTQVDIVGTAYDVRFIGS